MELEIDPERELKDNEAGTGIYVRAKTKDGRWESADITELTKASLLEWLRSRGGDNPYAEDVIGLVLGHGHLHDHSEEKP